MPLRERVEGVGSIAVLRANGLGDFVMALPALYALRAAYPDAEITLVGAPWHARFLSGRPGLVDQVLALPVVPGMVGTFEGEDDPEILARFLAGMRARRFDLALQMHGGGRQSNPLVRAFGARLTAGLRTPDAEPLDRWMHYDYYQPEVFRYLEVAGLVGAPPTVVEPVLELTPNDHEEARRVLAGLGGGADPLGDGDGDGAGDGRPLVVLNPGATDPRRRWPVDRFAAVGDALAGAGARVVVTGGPVDGDLPARVAGGMRHPAACLAGRLTLGGLGALFQRCALVVSNDTGPLHVAQAVGTRTVGVYWFGNLITAGPQTRARHRPQVSWTSRCPVCGRDCTVDLYPDREGAGDRCDHRVSFVTDVPVSEVREAALGLLAERTADRPTPRSPAPAGVATAPQPAGGGVNRR
jgi:ADP-heptose:LPS heptosyltransferase